MRLVRLLVVEEAFGWLPDSNRKRPFLATSPMPAATNTCRRFKPSHLGHVPAKPGLYLS